jgi:Fe-S oxidoreductase
VIATRARGLSDVLKTAAAAADELGMGSDLVDAREFVRTAALLRRDGRYDMALELLDDVVATFRHEDVEAAAYACAVRSTAIAAIPRRRWRSAALVPRPVG